MQKITIIGANSFLAKNFYQFVFKSEIEMEIYLYDIQDSFYINTCFEYKQIDFSDENELEVINYTVDAIYIFLGLTGTVKSLSDYKQYIHVNEEILLNILESYRKSRSKAKLIYPSTRLIYKGNTGKKVRECDTLEFKSVYSVTKFSAEKYIEMYHKLYDMPYCILRICTPFGSLLSEYGDYGTIGFFVRQAEKGDSIRVYGDGSVKKTYTHVKDICWILCECIYNSQLVNDTFNIGGVDKSLQEIGEMIALKYNVQVDNVEWPEIDKKIDGGSVIFDSKKIDDIISYNYSDLY